MTGSASTNITWHGAEASAQLRAQAMGQTGCVVWLTGLSGSGKSTVAHRVERLLLEQGLAAYVLDGDNLRHGLNADLGFSPADRVENIRRVGSVAALFAQAGVTCVTAFISPYQADRASARARVPEGRFVEVFIDTPIEVCEARDPKGLYLQARAGKIPEFTGISAPYEPPVAPELRVDTTRHDVDACARQVIGWLRENHLIGHPRPQADPPGGTLR